MIATTMDAIDALRVVLGIAQLLIGAVAIGLVLRGRRRSPQQPNDFRGGPAWAVAGWAVFGLLGLVWVVRALQR
jgi:multisubunit Na+/H+ antiporter MnhB subunit